LRYARDAGTGGDVDAHYARSSGRFTCPVCRAPVILRDGRYRAAHFAHRVSTARKECLLYHPSSALLEPWSIVSPSAPLAEPTPRLALSLTVEQTTVRGKVTGVWGLNVTVPKSPSILGEIVVDCGVGDHRHILLAKLAIGPQTYAVDLDAPSFFASWVSHEVPQEYGRRVRERIAGLAVDRFNVFLATKTKQRPAAGALIWGQDYYFLWRHDKVRTVPADIVVAALPQKNAWSCCLVSLPGEPDKELAAWLSASTHLGVVEPSQRWGVIYPPPLGIASTGDLLLPEAETLVLAFENGGPQDELRVSGGTGTETFTLPPLRTNMLAFVSSPEDRLCTLAWGPRPLQGLSWTPSAAAHVRQVRIEIADTITGEHGTYALHREEGSLALHRVRTHSAEAVLVDIPDGIRAVFRRRSLDQCDWEELTLPTDGQIAWLNAFLRDTEYDVHIDFGPFGMWAAGAVPREERSSAGRLTPEQRHKLEWLCVASGTFAATGLPVRQLSDAALSDLAKRMKVPPALAGHQRALTAEAQGGWR
jgi:hypothetical protein